MLLRNLKELKSDMVNKDWTICSFIFRYKGIEYIVLIKRFVGTEKRENPFFYSYDPGIGFDSVADVCGSALCTYGCR